jgi:hypothetical protein
MPNKAKSWLNCKAAWSYVRICLIFAPRVNRLAYLSNDFFPFCHVLHTQSSPSHHHSVPETNFAEISQKCSRLFEFSRSPRKTKRAPSLLETQFLVVVSLDFEFQRGYSRWRVTRLILILRYYSLCQLSLRSYRP